MSRRHARPRPSTPSVGRGRVRLMIVILAPLLVLAPLSAWAGQAVVKHHKATHHKAAAAKVGQKATAATAHGTSAAAAASDAAVTVAGTGWSRSFSPALSLLVNGSTAQFKSLALSFHVGAHQKATASARFRTDWV